MTDLSKKHAAKPAKPAKDEARPAIKPKQVHTLAAPQLAPQPKDGDP